MTDKEKVINALELCANGCNDNGCIYLDEQNNKGGLTVCRCIDLLARDALALLEEQEAEVENLKQTCQSMMEGICLLKEQEAVKPTWNRGKPFCGACGLQIRGGKFCSECGRPILWEG